jgi:hypothetical protein
MLGYPGADRGILRLQLITLLEEAEDLLGLHAVQARPNWSFKWVLRYSPVRPCRGSVVSCVCNAVGVCSVTAL